jgi:hypothetical protein
LPRYYEIEVALTDIQPLIWRRFLLRTISTFADLHKAIQESFGWQNYHLHEFRLPTYNGKPIAGFPGGEEYDRPTPDGRTVKLNTYFSGKVRAEWCEYVYDFGDDWVHEVKLRQVVSDKSTFRRRLLGGERACPPEDCGGVPGYQRMVRYLETGEDIYGYDDVDLGAWLGDWKPDAFDLEAVRSTFDR